MRDQDDSSNDIKPEALLQDYLDGLLGFGDCDAAATPSITVQAKAQDLKPQDLTLQAQKPEELPYQANQFIDRVAGDHGGESLIPRPTLATNNVLSLPRFAEARPLALKLPLPKLKPVTSVVQPQTKTLETKPVELEVRVEPVIEKIAEPVETVSDELLSVDEIEAALVDEIDESQQAQQTFVPREWLANGRPEWAQGRFECLMFSVGGLSLAVPLIELGNISPLTDELTPLFGQIDWFMGLLPTRNGKLRTVDTAKIVMPERYQDSLREKYRFVISIAGMDWGLAVDDVSTAISLSPEDVKWRSQRSKRPWLAGTLVAQMCAVLDIQQLALLLVQAQQNK
jgi:purine-binding chemotaxis protein CheW